MRWGQYMQTNKLTRKQKIIIIVSVLLLFLIIFILLITQSNRNNGVNVKMDDISGDEYSQEETGGENYGGLTFLGLTNLSKAGLFDSDIYTIQNDLNDILINKYNKKDGDIIRISKDNMSSDFNSFTGEGIIGFNVYLDEKNFIRVNYHSSNEEGSRKYITID